MPVETPSLFAQVIQDHLALKSRNSELEGQMPLERYKVADPFENHPLFKTEEQARIEETMDGEVALDQEAAAPAWPGVEPVAVAEAAPVADAESGEGGFDALWGKTRDFDWGD